MADWMFCLGCGDDLTSTPKERRNPRAASSACAPKEHVLLHGQVFLGNQNLSFNNVFQNPASPRNMCKKCFREYDKLSILFSLTFKAMSKLSVASST